jgi:hypothetical protein
VKDALDTTAESARLDAAPEPEFKVLGARARRYAALPTLDFDIHVAEPGGRQVYMVALSAQVMIEPARRGYDEGARERLVELFGPPERWSMTTRSMMWTQLDVIVPAFTGSTTFRVPVVCSYDHEVMAAKFFHSVRDGEAPLAFNFNGTPMDVWHELIDHYYPGTSWVPVRTDTLDALAREKALRGHPTFDACVADLLEGRP